MLLITGIKRYFIRNGAFDWTVVAMIVGFAIGFYLFISLLDWIMKKRKTKG